MSEGLAESLARFVSISAWSAASVEDRAVIVDEIEAALRAARAEQRVELADDYEAAMEAAGLTKYLRERIHEGVDHRAHVRARSDGGE